MFQKQKFNAIFIFQVGSFNYDNTKMRYNTYFLPSLPNSTDPILDYDVSIKKNIHIVCENVIYILILDISVLIFKIHFTI